MARNYNLTGTLATVSSAFKSVISVIATAAVRPTVYDFSVGTSGTPADNSTQWQAIRMSGTAGTATAATPNPLDSGDPAATSTAGSNYTVEQGTPGVIIFGNLDLNMRATYRWVAAPGCELVAPATAANSINLRTTSTAYTGVSDASMHFWE